MGDPAPRARATVQVTALATRGTIPLNLLTSYRNFDVIRVIFYDYLDCYKEVIDMEKKPIPDLMIITVV